MLVHGTFSNGRVTIPQYRYPSQCARAETRAHKLVEQEYAAELAHAMALLLARTTPNMRVYENQPFINGVVRHKLVDFLLKMLVRLKLLPFVFNRAVRLFDRYCLKRVVLLEQAQLVITTCLWIAAKVHGGNNHFANLHNDRNPDSVRTICDLAHGSGARFAGPTERYRFPKLPELIKLCGLRCNYTAEMFKQTELHILTTLEWDFCEPGLEEFMVLLPELRIVAELPAEARRLELFRIKQFAAYAAAFSWELVEYPMLDVARGIVDLVNETLRLPEADARFQRVQGPCGAGVAQRLLQRALVKAVVNLTPFLLQNFNTAPSQSFHLLVTAAYRLLALELLYMCVGKGALFSGRNDSVPSIQLSCLLRDQEIFDARWEKRLVDS